MRADGARSEHEMWSAIDEIRELVRAQVGGGDAARAPATSAPTIAGRRELRDFLADALPAGARVAVVSKGDDELIRLPGSRPSTFRARSAGATPAPPPDGTAAIAHLEWVRSNGADFLVFPHVRVVARGVPEAARAPRTAPASSPTASRTSASSTTCRNRSGAPPTDGSA